jgi:hypothetical protein
MAIGHGAGVQSLKAPPPEAPLAPPPWGFKFLRPILSGRPVPAGSRGNSESPFYARHGCGIPL